MDLLSGGDDGGFLRKPLFPNLEKLLDQTEVARSSLAAPSSLPPSEEKSPAQKLLDCLTSGKHLLAHNRVTKDSTLAWVRRVRAALFPMFGTEATIVKDLNKLLKDVGAKGLTRDQFVQKLAELESLSQYLNRLGSFPLSSPVSRTSLAPVTKNVFIIHGHDEINTLRLERLLQDHFGLTPNTMRAKAGKGRPLPVKFEDEAQTCSFAFALLTPDDEVIKSGKSHHQARPNVIYEVGWFIGRLGRERVNLILKNGTAIHSDLDGVSQIRFAENIEDKVLEIGNELKAASLIS